MDLTSKGIIILIVGTFAEYGNVAAANNSSGENPSCVTPGGLNGTCVNIQACPALVGALLALPVKNGSLDVVEQQSPHWDSVQFFRKFRCDGAHDFSVCCSGRASGTAAGTQHRYNNTKEDSLKCGYFSEDRIIAGPTAQLDSYPWLAIVENSANGSALCGGTLISSRHVLTASSCASGGAQSVRVRLGEYDTSTALDCVALGDDRDCADGALTTRAVSAVSARQGLALLTMDEDVPYSDFIVPVCLPSAGGASLVGELLHVSGWNLGRSTPAHAVKHQGLLEKVPGETCARSGSLPEGFECRKTWRNYGFRTADLGGPVTARAPQGRHQIVGVAADVQETEGDETLIFQRVRPHVDWIREIILL